jgi:PAS domain-containing protein
MAPTTEHAEVALRALVEHVPLGVAIFDAELRATHVNGALADTLGIDAQRLLGRTIPEAIPGLAAAEETLRRVVEAGEPMLAARVGGEVEPGSPPIYWTVDFFPLERADGSVGGVIGIGIAEA